MEPEAAGQLNLFDYGVGETWSYSRLKSFRRCPLEYKLRWLAGDDIAAEPTGIEVRAGRLVHQIVSEYYRCGLTSSPHHKLLEIYERWLREYEKRSSGGAVAWKLDPRGEERTLDALRLFADSRLARLEAVAQEVACKVYIGQVLFIGKADLLYRLNRRDSKFGIAEFKLNDVEVRSPDVVEKFLQCIIYILGLPGEFLGSTRVATIYVFDNGHLSEVLLEDEMIQRAQAIVEVDLQRARGPEFPAKVNPFCPSCGFRGSCPAYSESSRASFASLKALGPDA